MPFLLRLINSIRILISVTPGAISINKGGPPEKKLELARFWNSCHGQSVKCMREPLICVQI